MIPWNLELLKYESTRPREEPDLKRGPIKAERVRLFSTYQHSFTIRVEMYEGVNHNLPLNKGINVGIGVLSADGGGAADWITYAALP